MADNQTPRDFFKEFEWHRIEPKTDFYDALERRFFLNTTSAPIMIGFSHNVRKVELIAIGEARDEPKSEDSLSNALEGEIIEQPE